MTVSNSLYVKNKINKKEILDEPWEQKSHVQSVPWVNRRLTRRQHHWRATRPKCAHVKLLRMIVIVFPSFYRNFLKFFLSFSNFWNSQNFPIKHYSRVKQQKYNEQDHIECDCREDEYFGSWKQFLLDLGKNSPFHGKLIFLFWFGPTRKCSLGVNKLATYPRLIPSRK